MSAPSQHNPKPQTTCPSPRSCHNPFRSRRLLYTALDPSLPEDVDFFTSVQRDDVEAQANSNYALLRPLTRADCEAKLKREVEESLLCVGIELVDGGEDGKGGEVLAGGEGGEGGEVLAGGEEMERTRVRVGVLTLTGSSPRTAQHRCSMIGVDVVKGHQGKGYGSESILWALRWAFLIAGLHRVEIDAFSYNAGAVRLYARLGFKQEAVKEQAVWFGGGWHDIVGFAMLEEVWWGMYGGEDG